MIKEPVVKKSVRLSSKLQLEAYKHMYSSRFLDEKMQIMLRQGKSYFHIGCMGHEAVQVACGMAMKKGFDYLFPYYRDQALCMTLGQTPYECLLAFLGRADDPHSGGRQMPMHYGNKSLNIPTSSSSTGTQFLQGVGCAMASKRLYKKGKNEDLAVSVICAGEGTTSQGEFYEAISLASKDELPVIFLVENNRYAISVNINEQRPGGKVAKNFKNFSGLNVLSVDGCDVKKSYAVLQNAISEARIKCKPALIDADVIRLLPHSSSDDHKKYRSEEELNADKRRDPVLNFRNELIKQELISDKKLKNLEKQIKDEIEEASEKALKNPFPKKESATYYVWSKDKEPSLTKPNIKDDSPLVVMVDAINRALCEGLESNDKMLVFGQDVAHGKGGVFTATRNLTKEFKDRCFNSPLAEASIVGTAIGLAMSGFKPVAEIQFADYIWTAMMQIRNELCTIRYRSNNDFFSPVVLRVPVGGYIHGGLCHSQNIEATFAHFPGIKIAYPSTAIDAYGLLKNSITSNDPVLFLEHKALYRQGFARSQLPHDGLYSLPFGKGVVRRKGRDMSIITYGILSHRAQAVANRLASKGIDAEVIDLRTINPFDKDLVFASVKKTSRVLILHEDMKFMGFGAEIAAQIAQNCFNYLDAPVMRVCAHDTPVPYSPPLEEAILPQDEDIVQAIKKLKDF